MKKPTVNLLPCPESLSKGTRTFLTYILFILTLAEGFSYAAEGLGIKASKIPLPLLIKLPCYMPSGVLTLCLTLCTTYVYIYVVKGMQTFYMPYKKLWIAYLSLICLSALLSLLPMANVVESVEFILELSAGIVYIVLGYRIRKSYSGKISMLGTAMMWSIIVGVMVLVFVAFYLGAFSELSYWDRMDARKSAFWIVSIPLVLVNLIGLWPVMVSFALFEKGEAEEYIEPGDLPETYGQPEA